MTETPVELDDHPEADVLDIAVARRESDANPTLATTGRETVGALHPVQMATFEHRVRAGGDVGQDRGKEPTMPEPGHFLEVAQEPSRGRTTGLRRIGEDGDGASLVGCLRRHLEQRSLQTQPGRPEMQLCVLLERLDPAHRDSRRRLGTSARRYGDLDPFSTRGRSPGQAQPMSPQGRAPPECGRPVAQHRSPRTLLPGRRAGVIQEDPVEDSGELADRFTLRASGVSPPLTSSRHLACGSCRECPIAEASPAPGAGKASAIPGIWRSAAYS